MTVHGDFTLNNLPAWYDQKVSLFIIAIATFSCIILISQVLVVVLAEVVKTIPTTKKETMARIPVLLLLAKVP